MPLHTAMFRLSEFRLTPLQYTWNLALFFASFGNLALWRQLWHVADVHGAHEFLFLLSLPLFFFTVFNLLFSFLAWPWLRKPLFAFLLFASAACSYFMLNYRVVIDRGMMQNLFETDSAEFFSYLSPSLLLYLLVLGILPALLILRVRKRQSETLWGGIAAWSGNIALSCLILLALAFCFYKDYASLFRNNPVLVHTITPINFLKNGYSYFSRRHDASQPMTVIGEDAMRPTPVTVNTRPKLLVLVVGETARARNFSLNGYEHPTNPLLSARPGVISFRDVTSCGTATAVSLPCMFSRLSREKFDADRAAHEENLLDILQRVGIEVFWRDNNNSGCKGVCARVPREIMPLSKNPSFCTNPDGTCHDEVLLDRLGRKIDALKGDAVIVLHQLGSHGPTYYQRYPESAKKFTPTCDTNQIQRCDTESLVNTYDNTLLYTDRMLDEAIGLLAERAKNRDVALIYLSDHGESLGEKGMYLHGTPYMIAPEEQKKIPMVMWFSPEFTADTGIDPVCLKQNAQRNAYSQDNLFHSVLGLFSIRTKEYRSDLDLFSACRADTLVTLAARPR